MKLFLSGFLPGVLLASSSVSAVPLGKLYEPIFGLRVKSLVEGAAVGSWPDNPVQLNDGRIFYNEGEVKQIVNGSPRTLQYTAGECPPMNGSMVLAGTTDNRLVVGFSPRTFDKINDIVGIINPDNLECEVVASAPEGTSEIVALTTDKNDAIYYVIAAGVAEVFQFFKLLSGKQPQHLFSVTGNMPNSIAVDASGSLYASWYSKDNSVYSNQITRWDAETNSCQFMPVMVLRASAPMEQKQPMLLWAAPTE